MTKLRTYSELIKLPTFEERYKYLKLDGKIGKETFGYERWINQEFYHSEQWKRIRRKVILRDNACDLAVEGCELNDHIIIHHMNPLIMSDLVDKTDALMNPEYLICCSIATHNAIHYGNGEEILHPFVERYENDQCPWR